jgi:hypothetical protein
MTPRPQYTNNIANFQMHEVSSRFQVRLIKASQKSLLPDFTPGPSPGNSALPTKQASERKPLTLGHPDFEGFEVIQTIEDTHPRPGSRPWIGGSGFAASGDTMAGGARLRARWLSGLFRPCPNGS